MPRIIATAIWGAWIGEVWEYPHTSLVRVIWERGDKQTVTDYPSLANLAANGAEVICLP